MNLITYCFVIKSVVSPEDFKTWLADKPTMAQQKKDAMVPAETVAPDSATDSTMVEAPIVVLAN